MKPCGISHAFWNPGPEPERVMEIFPPAGFERYFAELAELLSACGPPDMPRVAALAGRYGLTIQWERIGEILQRHNLILQ